MSWQPGESRTIASPSKRLTDGASASYPAGRFSAAATARVAVLVCPIGRMVAGLGISCVASGIHVGVPNSKTVGQGTAGRRIGEVSRIVIAIVCLSLANIMSGCLHIRLAVDSPEQRCKDLFEGAEWIPPSCKAVLDTPEGAER